MSRLLDHKRNQEGFTLFELLIVIVILAVLAGIVASSVGTSNANALTSSCQSDAKAFETALQEYNADVGRYPILGAGDVGYDGQPSTGLTQQFTYDGQTVGPFLRQLSGTAHYQIVTDGAGGVFVYPAAPAPIDPTSGGMDPQTVDGVLGDGDTNQLDFEKNPAICSDANLFS